MALIQVDKNNMDIIVFNVLKDCPMYGMATIYCSNAK